MADPVAEATLELLRAFHVQFVSASAVSQRNQFDIYGVVSKLLGVGVIATAVPVAPPPDPLDEIEKIEAAIERDVNLRKRLTDPPVGTGEGSLFRTPRWSPGELEDLIEEKLTHLYTQLAEKVSQLGG